MNRSSVQFCIDHFVTNWPRVKQHLHWLWIMKALLLIQCYLDIGHCQITSAQADVSFHLSNEQMKGRLLIQMQYVPCEVIYCTPVFCHWLIGHHAIGASKTYITIDNSMLVAVWHPLSYKQQLWLNRRKVWKKRGLSGVPSGDMVHWYCLLVVPVVVTHSGLVIHIITNLVIIGLVIGLINIWF